MSYANLEYSSSIYRNSGQIAWIRWKTIGFDHLVIGSRRLMTFIYFGKIGMEIYTSVRKIIRFFPKCPNFKDISSPLKNNYELDICNFITICHHFLTSFWNQNKLC